MDEIRHRQIEDYGNMSEQTVRNLIEKAFSYGTHTVTFGFQGGEPTLMGLDFFRAFCKLVKEQKPKQLHTVFTLQTNGTLLTPEWTAFFKENNFLVGLSLDGPRSIHNLYRKDQNGDGTFKAVLHAAKLLKEAKVDFNILATLSEDAAREIDYIYRFFMSKGFNYQQFIPCIDPLDGDKLPESLTAKSLGKALNQLFDLWYADLTRGVQVYNRYFENLVAIAGGREPECCDMSGHCNEQYVIEADGSVYPCDFYVLEEYRLGNVNDGSFPEFVAKNTELKFIERSMEVDKECAECKYYKLCRGGCRRNRPLKEGHLQKNRFCEAYKTFFEYTENRIRLLADALL